MSKAIAVFPQDQYRFELYDNVKRFTRQQIQKEKGCYALANLWLFSLKDQPKYGVKYFDHQNGGVMLQGKWEYEKYSYPGICIDNNGRLTTGWKNDAVWDYAACANASYVGGVKGNITPYPRNGLTYTGLTASGDVVILLATNDTPMTGDEAVEEMHNAGCVDILRWDGSWSSQGYLGPGMDIQPSQKRLVRGYLLIYKRDDKNEEDKPVSKKVCLDPGHGAETPGKCSPDGTYHEAEFALDLAQRMEKILTRCGVEVTLTRKDEHTLTGGATNAESYARVAVANGISGLDLYVSLHSNAAAGTGWSSARGMLCITSASGDTAGRNKAAKAILARMKEAGVLVRSEPLTHDPAYIVLRQTAAPAMIVEYGFHTNKNDVALLKDSAYRDKLAVATAKGVCDYLGVAYKDAPMEEAPVDDPTDWAAAAWLKVKDKGVMDGTRPTDGITRQELAVVLDRVGLI